MQQTIQPFRGPRGQQLVIQGALVETEERALALYVDYWARVRHGEQRGGARPADVNAVRQLGEALARQRGCTPYDVQISVRREVAAAYRELAAAR